VVQPAGMPATDGTKPATLMSRRGPAPHRGRLLAHSGVRALITLALGVL